MEKIANASGKIDYHRCDDKTHAFARRAYERYFANSDGKSHNGMPMPTWDDLLAKESPVVSHWCASVAEIAACVDRLGMDLDACRVLT